jgi:DNA-damage-inducible protein J
MVEGRHTMTHASMVHVGIDHATKRQAKAVLDAVWLSLSEAVRIFLERIAANRAFPFMPNAPTCLAMAEADELIAKHSVRFKTDN